MRKNRFFEWFGLSGGSIIGVSGGILAGSTDDRKQKIVGGAIIGFGVMFFINGFISGKKFSKYVYKSVDAYNQCKGYTTQHIIQWSKPSLGIASTPTIYGANNTGLKLTWTIK